MFWTALQSLDLLSTNGVVAAGRVSSRAIAQRSSAALCSVAMQACTAQLCRAGLCRVLQSIVQQLSKAELFCTLISSDRNDMWSAGRPHGVPHWCRGSEVSASTEAADHMAHMLVKQCCKEVN